MSSVTKIVLLYLNQNNYRDPLMRTLVNYGFTILHKNRNHISFTYPDLGEYQIIFRDISSNNYDIYKYAEEGCKVFYIYSRLFSWQPKITTRLKLREEDGQYFYPCIYKGKMENLPVELAANYNEFIEKAFNGNTKFYKTFYRPIFNNDIFEDTYEELNCVVLPVGVKAFLTKESARAYALNEMVSRKANCIEKVSTNKKTIENYLKNIERKESENMSLENKIQKLNAAIAKME